MSGIQTHNFSGDSYPLQR